MNLFFSNPAWLLGALAAIPLLAHLFSKTRPRRRSFPSLKLLREALRRVTRIRRPRDRWLLLVRTLAILALIGAFLQPWLLSRFASGGGVAKNVVIVMDVTASMGYAEGTRTRLADATAAAEDVLATLPAGSMANIVWLRARAAGELPEPGPNIDFLRQSLRQASARPEHGDVEGALALAVKQLSNAPGERELVVVSDFQKSEWRNVQWQIPPAIRTTPIQVGSGADVNTGLAGLAIEPPRPVAGQEARLVCRVRNFSGEPRRSTVFAEAGESRLSHAVEVAPWSETLAVLTVKFPREGIVPVKASLAEDRFPGDDVAYALAEVRGSLQVGVAGPTGDATARLWLRAAQSLDGVAARRVERLDAPGDLDVLFISRWYGESVPVLSTHLRRGAALIIQPAEGLDPAAIHALFGQPATPGEAPLAAEVKDAGWRPRIAAQENPVFSIFTTGAYGDPESALFTRRIAVPSFLKGTPLLAFDDGRPALLLIETGDRRTDRRFAWWNLDLGASDWSARSAFVTFFGEFLRHIGAGAVVATPRHFQSGDPLRFDVATALDPAGVTLLNQRDDVVKLAPAASGSHQLVSAGEAVPGSYRWMAQNGVLDRAAVFFPEVESDLRRMSTAEIQTGGAEVITGAARARLGELREGKPLWPWFLATAAFLFLLEGVLLRLFPISRDPLPAPRKASNRKEAASV